MSEKLRANEWLVQPIGPHGEAVRLITAWHYARGAPNTSTYRHGLYRVADGPLWGDACGVALWIPPTRTAAESVAHKDWQGVLSLSRLVVEPGIPSNAASFLLARSMRLIDRERWPVLLTYADTSEGHTGAIYQATNWVRVGEVPAGDVWIGPDGRQCGRKRGGRTYLAAEMELAGYRRKRAAPKIKFIHRISA